MADLESCYFCGSPADLREYPVIPQELYPPDDVQRTVALCSTCREKLASVLEPLLDFVEPPDAPAREPAAHDEREIPREAAHGGASDADAPGAGESTPDPSTPDDGEDAPDPTDPSTPADPPDRSGPAGSQDAGASTGDGRRLADLVDDAEERPRYTSSRGAGYRWKPGETSRSSPIADLPRGTRSVARLLQNRPFPVDRDEIETLAASAYDLDRGECTDVVDALVEAGYLTERDGELDHPG